MKNEDLIAHWCTNGIDPDRCHYTGWPLGGAGEVDHLIPPARGGTDNPENLVPCLSAVKQVKNIRTEGEFLALLDSVTLEIAV